MSLRVMQRKYYERIKNNEINSKQVFSINATNVGITKSKCRNDIVNPTTQKCYGVYNRQVLSGNNGLAAKVIDISANYVPTITNTYKRPPQFQANQYIANKRSKAIRCMFFDEDCNKVTRPTPVSRNCDCKKSTIITQDLQYLSAKDYMEKKLATRNITEDGVTQYESNMMKNIHGHCA